MYFFIWWRIYVFSYLVKRHFLNSLSWHGLNLLILIDCHYWCLRSFSPGYLSSWIRNSKVKINCALVIKGLNQAWKYRFRAGLSKSKSYICYSFVCFPNSQNFDFSFSCVCASRLLEVLVWMSSMIGENPCTIWKQPCWWNPLFRILRCFRKLLNTNHFRLVFNYRKAILGLDWNSKSMSTFSRLFSCT